MVSSRWRVRSPRRRRRLRRPQPPALTTRRWEHATYRSAAGTRSYAVYTPPGLDPRRPVPVWVMLHGCTQDAADIAAGTRLDALADRAGFLVIYPEQGKEHNARGCWNWFDPENQARGSGEPAIIAGITRAVLEGRSTAVATKPLAPTLDRSRVYVTGISAGGAMAAILGATYPDLYAAVGMHSGSQYGAARNVASALLAMATAGPDPDRQGRLAHAAMGGRSRVVPVVVIQGDRDRTVRTRNGDHATRQWLATNRLASRGAAGWDFTKPDAQRLEQADGRDATVRWWYDPGDPGGPPVVEYWLVDGLGHAWSGGAPEGSYTDPKGPDATAVMHRFLSRHQLGARALPVGVLARRMPALPVPAQRVRSLLGRVIGALLHPVRTVQSLTASVRSRRAAQPARRPRRPFRIRR